MLYFEYSVDARLSSEKWYHLSKETKMKRMRKAFVKVFKMLSFMTMKDIVFYEKKFIKKSFLISQYVSCLIQSCWLSDLS